MKCSLDVGCGTYPRGTVNVDKYRFSKEVREGVTERTKADIIATGEHLPFQTSVFDIVYSVHTIEHSEEPALFLRELIRVSKDKVMIACPHRLSLGCKKKVHRSYFRCSWFHTELRKLGVGFSISRAFNVFPARSIIGVSWVSEILVRVRKGK